MELEAWDMHPHCRTRAGCSSNPDSSFMNERKSVVLNTRGCGNTVWQHLWYEKQTHTQTRMHTRTHTQEYIAVIKAGEFDEITFDFRTGSWTNFQVSKVFHCCIPSSQPLLLGLTHSFQPLLLGLTYRAAQCYHTQRPPLRHLTKADIFLLLSVVLH